MHDSSCEATRARIYRTQPAVSTIPAAQGEDWCRCGHLREHHDEDGCYRGDPGAGWACACQDRADGYETWQPTGGHMTLTWGESTGPAPNELPERTTT